MSSVKIDYLSITQTYLYAELGSLVKVESNQVYNKFVYWKHFSYKRTIVYL